MSSEARCCFRKLLKEFLSSSVENPDYNAGVSDAWWGIRDWNHLSNMQSPSSTFRTLNSTVLDWQPANCGGSPGAHTALLLIRGRMPLALRLSALSATAPHDRSTRSRSARMAIFRIWQENLEQKLQKNEAGLTDPGRIGVLKWKRDSDLDAPAILTGSSMICT